MEGTTDTARCRAFVAAAESGTYTKAAEALNYTTSGISQLVTTPENYAAISMIESGLGMSIMNELITKDFQADVVVLPLEPPQSITLGMAIPSAENAPPAVRKFREYVTQRFPEAACAV